MNSSDPTLEPFFNPQGVAIVGASHDPTKLGFGLSRNLIQSGYRGAIHLVNLKGGELLGRPVYRRLAEVPDPLDLAVLLIPAAGAPAILEECAARGLHAAIIASGGFRETGAAGAELEALCLEVARKHDIRLIGPNCIGMLDTHLPIDTTFLSPPGPTPGDVAFISHSGAICAAVIDWARGQGFGLSRLVSLGNQVDVNETDMLAPVASDPYTRVLTLYLEGVSDGRRFVAEAQRVSQIKPIVALKVGRYASGQQAVASHTGALAGSESAFNAAFRRAGVVRVETSEELFDWARALAWCPPPRGRGVAVLTNSGGPGVTAADAIEASGLRLAQLSAKTRDALRAILTPAASLNNPVDMLAAASPQQYANCLSVLLTDPDVHMAMIILPPPPMHTAGGVAKAVIPVIYTADKPVVVALMGERLIQEAVEYFRAARVPDYRFPERAAAALRVLVQRAESLAQTQNLALNHGANLALTGIYPQLVQNLIADRRVRDYAQAADGCAGAADGDGFLTQEDTQQILQAYGIPLPRAELAENARKAAEIARQIGFPVALKIASAGIPHKSDVGGVMLDLKDEVAVVQGFTTITHNARQACPDAIIQGVQVQRMIPGGQEVIIGAVQDQQFGPLVMFGSGGVEVEGLKDVQFELAPLSRAQAESLLNATWAGKKLHGYRNIPPADVEAVIDVILRLAQLAVDFPELLEIEINPLRVLRTGQGVFAVDTRLRLAAERSGELTVR